MSKLPKVWTDQLDVEVKVLGIVNPSEAPPADVVEDIADEHDNALLGQWGHVDVDGQATLVHEWWPEQAPNLIAGVVGGAVAVAPPRKPIMVRRGIKRLSQPIKVKRAPVNLYDEKGRVRLGPCGHPLHPAKGCRVCPLLAQGEKIEARAAFRAIDDGRRARALAKWGSRKGRRRANSYKPAPVEPESSGHIDGVVDMDAAMAFFDNHGSHAREWATAVMRICPERSRTIRFRHTPFPRSVEGLGEPLVIGGQHAGQYLYQQAVMTQSMLDDAQPPTFEDLPSGLYGVDVDDVDDVG